jgi:hypothetical protein
MCVSVWNQACVACWLAGLRQGFARPALLMLGAAGCIHARLAKNFLAQKTSSFK